MAPDVEATGGGDRIEGGDANLWDLWVLGSSSRGCHGEFRKFKWFSCFASDGEARSVQLRKEIDYSKMENPLFIRMRRCRFGVLVVRSHRGRCSRCYMHTITMNKVMFTRPGASTRTPSASRLGTLGEFASGCYGMPLRVHGAWCRMGCGGDQCVHGTWRYRGVPIS